ncbi:Glucosamine-phosphate N-acetyltransferase-like protein [Dissophora globulifera]|nr:Glucosamine-phosphate N-acetyltransferase-like protein [Dissophora globulifera]
MSPHQQLQPQAALFSPSLISTVVQSQLPEGYLMRPLEVSDYHKGYYDCLAGLTVVGDVSEDEFARAFKAMARCQNVYHVVVIEDLNQARIVATGTLIVEQKFLRGCGKAGHIEDIVVHDSQRGKKFGIRLIDQLRHIGTQVGCYKLLLTCSQANEPFYQKSGFECKDLNMALYLNQQQPQQPQQHQQQTSSETFPTTTTANIISGMASADCSNNTSLSSSMNSHGMTMESLSASLESVYVK